MKEASRRRTKVIKWHSRVPWVEKLRPDLEPKLVRTPGRRGKMLVPTPLLIAEELRKVRRGRLITAARLRERLAAHQGAEATCPMTTGILLHILAGASEELLSAGRRPTAPYWRVVDERGRLNPKWPPGPARQAEHLRAGGHRVTRERGSGYWVVKGQTR
jgi:hypothetical protein